jgi:hypothetical protein
MQERRRKGLRHSAFPLFLDSFDASSYQKANRQCWFPSSANDTAVDYTPLASDCGNDVDSKSRAVKQGLVRVTDAVFAYQYCNQDLSNKFSFPPLTAPLNRMVVR